jgi:hypothetical protein
VIPVLRHPPIGGCRNQNLEPIWRIVRIDSESPDQWVNEGSTGRDPGEGASGRGFQVARAELERVG